LLRKRAHGDLPDDRQFAVGREAHGVAGRHRRVVDHHAHGLGPRLAGGRSDVVQRSGGELGDGRDVIEQRGETGGHEKSWRWLKLHA
jgi:hypothetical protein